MKIKRIGILALSVILSVILCGCTKKETGHIYKITEMIDDGAYNEYMDGAPDTFEKLKIFKDKLVTSPEFSYYPYAENMVEVLSAEIPAECLVNYGTEFEAESRYEINGESASCVNAIQISEDYLSLFPVNVYKGNRFTAGDFNYQNAEYIPVLLGKAYQDVFELGDTFEGYYILERRTFKVIGFAGNAGFYSTASNSQVSYDHYIIMPFMEVETDSFAARAILLQQVNGLVEYGGGREEVLKIIRRYLEEAGLESWSDGFGFLRNEVMKQPEPSR